MKIFVAGGTGVLGRRVIRKLIDGGHQVAGLSRSDRNNALLKQLGAEPRSVDLFDAPSVIRAASDCDVVLHLATAIPTKSRSRASDWILNDRIRREGTRNLLEAAIRNGPRLYIQQSITFLYGNRNGAWVDETVPIAATQLSVIQSAADMEGLVADAMVKHNLPAMILRFGSFYSHDSAQTSSMFNLIANGRLPIVGDGSPYWNTIHVDDAALAVARAVEAGSRTSGKVFNVCEAEPVRYGDLVHYLAEMTNARPPRHIPAFLARLVLGRETVQFMLASVRCKSAAARAELGWDPEYPSYREGYRAAFDRWVAATNI